MDFKQIDIKNFLTLSEASIELDGRGLLLVQGDNEDDTSAGSNGAGKSSILDALSWVLYGVTARGVTGDSIVNRKAGKGCEVALVLTEGDREYRVVRHRKHATGKNSVTASERNLTTGVGVDLTKGTDKETQEVINKIMGCGHDVFCGAIYAGQERTPDLPGMTDKNLKSLLEEAAGTEILTEAYAEARTRLLTVERNSQAIAQAGAAAEEQHKAITETLRQLDEKIVAFNDGRKLRASEHLMPIKTIQAKIEEIDRRLSETDVAEIDRQIAEANKAVDGRKAEELQLEGLRSVAADKKIALDRKQLELHTTIRTVKDIKLGLDEITSLVGKACGECGKEYCAHDLGDAQAAQQKKLDERVAAGTALKVEVAALTEAHTIAHTAFSTFSATMTDVSAQIARIRELSGQKALMSTLVNGRKVLEGQIEAARAAAKAELTKDHPWVAALEMKREELKQVSEKIHSLGSKLKDVEAEVELYKDAVKVFGPAGVRAHVLDTITPFLNERTRDYLGAMSDGNIHAVWSTLTKNSKGELKEKFNIEVTNDKGGDSFAALSGGEKRKVRLATMMALQDLVASRATKSLNIFIADEIDHALDQAGLERLMGVLEAKARERGTVLVVSHQSLSDWISNVVTVTKKGGVSVVSGSTHRGF